MSNSFLIKPLLGYDYPTIEYGKGIFLYDSDGKEYVDGCSGAVTANIGHGMEGIIQKMTIQGERISFVYRSQFTNEPAEELAQYLGNEVPYAPWCFFVNSGSEAVETAIKIAIQYWQEKKECQKQIILSRWISYHGITLGALGLSGHGGRRERFERSLLDRPLLEPPYCSSCPFEKTYPSCQLLCARQLETVIKRLGAGNIAAFIAEPIIGAAGGCIDAPIGYYEEIKRICDKYGILFIADEVMTGCGRTGRFLALEHWGVKADIIALGKGLSAGYSPLAATLVSEKIIQTIENGSGVIMSGHTYSGNPLSCSAALAVQNFIKDRNLLVNISTLSPILFEKLNELVSLYPFINEVRGKGYLIGIECTPPEQSGAEAFTNLMIQSCKEEGLLVYPAGSGIDGRSLSAIIIAPPFTITLDEIDLLLERLKRGLNRIKGE
ncbi:hypothetical protein Q75_08110 [Bacillus coahuilensis p1.1.43]|uniref:Aminotransferase class III n=1 Tax=Bacillus coahuilensis p1.1.43 TaxID=1150625 RepID=A0A147K8G1_9BACI|nr:aspartate aminotransferase family protein [Bacillus coahuilensis]KUP06483.1 hypothetical protein Q75_08110 [Bacillus coahuilensis p1.1.43]